MSTRRRGRGARGEDDDGPVLVYGRNPVRELIRAGRRPVQEVWALAQAAEDPELAGVTVVVKRREDLANLAGTGDHQGMVAITEEYPYADPQAVLEGDGPIMVLDEVQDPRNLGAVARVADAAGFAGLVIPTRGSPGITAVACKASAGAVAAKCRSSRSARPNWPISTSAAARRAPVDGSSTCRSSPPVEKPRPTALPMVARQNGSAASRARSGEMLSARASTAGDRCGSRMT